MSAEAAHDSRILDSGDDAQAAATAGAGEDIEPSAELINAAQGSVWVGAAGRAARVRVVASGVRRS